MINKQIFFLFLAAYSTKACPQKETRPFASLSTINTYAIRQHFTPSNQPLPEIRGIDERIERISNRLILALKSLCSCNKRIKK